MTEISNVTNKLCIILPQNKRYNVTELDKKEQANIATEQADLEFQC